MPTLRAFFHEQYLPMLKQKNRSWKDDRGRFEHRILPRFGDHQLNAITRKDVAAWLVELTIPDRDSLPASFVT